jgi:hypothetical protein
MRVQNAWDDCQARRERDVEHFARVIRREKAPLVGGEKKLAGIKSHAEAGQRISEEQHRSMSVLLPFDKVLSAQTSHSGCSGLHIPVIVA